MQSACAGPPPKAARLALALRLPTDAITAGPALAVCALDAGLARGAHDTATVIAGGLEAFADACLAEHGERGAASVSALVLARTDRVRTAPVASAHDRAAGAVHAASTFDTCGVAIAASSDRRRIEAGLDLDRADLSRRALARRAPQRGDRSPLAPDEGLRDGRADAARAVRRLVTARDPVTRLPWPCPRSAASVVAPEAREARALGQARISDYAFGRAAQAVAHRSLGARAALTDAVFAEREDGRCDARSVAARDRHLWRPGAHRRACLAQSRRLTPAKMSFDHPLTRALRARTVLAARERRRGGRAHAAAAIRPRAEGPGDAAVESELRRIAGLALTPQRREHVEARACSGRRVGVTGQRSQLREALRGSVTIEARVAARDDSVRAGKDPHTEARVASSAGDRHELRFAPALTLARRAVEFGEEERRLLARGVRGRAAGETSEHERWDQGSHPAPYLTNIR